MKANDFIQHTLFKTGIGILLWVITTGMIFGNMGEESEKSCKAYIEVEHDEQTTRFNGILENTGKQPVDADYSMETIKEGVSGRSTSRQGGSAVAKAGEKVTLSTTQINITEGDQYTIILKVFSEDQILCSDTLVQGN